MAPKKDKGKKNTAVSQGSTTRGKKRHNSTTQADDQSPPQLLQLKLMIKAHHEILQLIKLINHL